MIKNHYLQFYANRLKYMVSGVIYKLFSVCGNNPQLKQSFYISTLADNSLQQRNKWKIGTKYCKGNPRNLFLRSNRSTRAAKVFKKGCRVIVVHCERLNRQKDSIYEYGWYIKPCVYELFKWSIFYWMSEPNFEFFSPILFFF